MLIGLIAWRVFQSDTLVPRASRVVGFIFFARLALRADQPCLAATARSSARPAAQGTAYFYRPDRGGHFAVGDAYQLDAADHEFLRSPAFSSHFDVAWENMMIRIDEWRAKRQRERADLRAAAVERSGKRKGIRIGKDAELPSTIVVGESVPAGKVRKRQPALRLRMCSRRLPMRPKHATLASNRFCRR